MNQQARVICSYSAREPQEMSLITDEVSNVILFHLFF